MFLQLTFQCQQATPENSEKGAMCELCWCNILLQRRILSSFQYLSSSEPLFYMKKSYLWKIKYC